MMQTLAHIALVIHDYDEAIDYYTRVMGFELLEDSPREPGKRWVLVAPRGNRGSSLLLARAASPEQQSRVGNQTGGRVFLFLHTDDFRRDHETLLANGVHFIESPRYESYGTVAVFEDLYGNRWDLIERKS
jgi:catechol 2,3-dioxygenase-like lactoylglutathione lyase family enzyme